MTPSRGWLAAAAAAAVATIALLVHALRAGPEPPAVPGPPERVATDETGATGVVTGRRGAGRTTRPPPAATTDPPDAGRTRVRILEPTTDDPAGRQRSAMARLDRARAAFEAGNWGAALAGAEAALVVLPDAVAARELAVQAACNLGDGERAQKHLASLTGIPRRRAAVYCQALAITLPE